MEIPKTEYTKPPPGSCLRSGQEMSLGNILINSILYSIHTTFWSGLLDHQKNNHSFSFILLLLPSEMPLLSQPSFKLRYDKQLSSILLFFLTLTFYLTCNFHRFLCYLHTWGAISVGRTQPCPAWTSSHPYPNLSLNANETTSNGTRFYLRLSGVAFI